MKTTAYIRCFIDMSLYNNFNEESQAHELWEKISIMFQNKNAANQVSVFRKLVRLRYQDRSSMAEHMNAVEIQSQHRPDRLKKPRTESVGTDRLGRVPSRLGPIG